MKKLIYLFSVLILMSFTTTHEKGLDIKELEIPVEFKSKAEFNKNDLKKYNIISEEFNNSNFTGTITIVYDDNDKIIKVTAPKNLPENFIKDLTFSSYDENSSDLIASETPADIICAGLTGWRLLLCLITNGF